MGSDILVPMNRRLIVTHHAPVFDAVGAVWMLKRFDTQHFASAQVAFVNPGEQISLVEAEKRGCQLHEVTYVDTGMGEFDHHQPERGHDRVCATSLTYDHICRIHPELKNDRALQTIVEFATDVDHFGDVYWPEPAHTRYTFMIHELIRGLENLEWHNDDSQLQFGLECLDSAYAALIVRLKAEKIIADEGIVFTLPAGRCLALETSNDDTLKVAQKQGFVLVIRKDTKVGNIRVKARPDSEIDLQAAYHRITKIDTKGTWFYHPSGKMLLNGSRKHHNQIPSSLSLQEMVSIIKETYGSPAT